MLIGVGNAIMIESVNGELGPVQWSPLGSFADSAPQAGLLEEERHPVVNVVLAETDVCILGAEMAATVPEIVHALKRRERYPAVLPAGALR